MTLLLPWYYNQTLQCLEAAAPGASYRVYERLEERYAAWRVELDNHTLVLGRFFTIREAIGICVWDQQHLF